MSISSGFVHVRVRPRALSSSDQLALQLNPTGEVIDVDTWDEDTDTTEPSEQQNSGESGNAGLIVCHFKKVSWPPALV